MKKTKKLLTYIFILLVFIIIGTGLLIAAYMLPTDRIYSNVQKSSCETGDYEYPFIIPGNKTSMLDGFTDLRELIIASYNNGNSVVDRAMSNYYISCHNSEGEELGPFDTIRTWCDSNTSNTQIKEHSMSRYWLGFLVFLKPLLCFFSYSDIRMLCLYVQIVLLFYFIFLLGRKNRKELVVIYAISIVILNPAALSVSMMYSSIYILLMISMIILLKYYDVLNKNKYFGFYFLIVGICTSYFDFLSYPLVTFGLPFLLFVNLSIDKKFSTLIREEIICGLSWIMGYIGMWAGKWCVGSILTGKNMFLDAIGSLLYRTSSSVDGIEVTRAYAISSNLDIITTPIFIFCYVISLLLLLMCIVKHNPKDKNIVARISMESILKILNYLLISFIPFAWFLATTNHSYIHHWMTYRILSITIGGVYSCFWFIIKNIKEKRKNE